jgi:hypothetical protein
MQRSDGGFVVAAFGLHDDPRIGARHGREFDR